MFLFYMINLFSYKPVIFPSRLFPAFGLTLSKRKTPFCLIKGEWKIFHLYMEKTADGRQLWTISGYANILVTIKYGDLYRIS